MGHATNDHPTTSSRDAACRPAEPHLVRHNQALQAPRGAECAITLLRSGLLRYAVEYADRFEGCQLGHDAILGEAWLTMARGYLALLNGETGRLDCGVLDSELRRWAAMYEFTPEEVDSL